jgi:hypothetical protein
MFQNNNNNNSSNFELSIEIESLYIAHVFQNISKKRISSIFENLFLAKVKGIDFVTKIGKDKKPYNSAYIHIDYWFDTNAAKHFQEKIRTSSEALLVYDEPWYWIINENKSEEKSRFIQKAEKEKLEGTNTGLSKMMMTLDNLEKLCSRDLDGLNMLSEEYKKDEEDYEEAEYQLNIIS